MPKQRVLVVDDEQGMLEVCADILSSIPDVLVSVELDGVRAAERIEIEEFDLLLLDMHLPGTNGADLLRKAKQINPDTLVLMMTAYPDVSDAVDCIKIGAEDYITKPFLPDDLRAAVKGLLDRSRLHHENRLLEREGETPHRFDGMIGKCEAMQKVFETIRLVAPTDADVLIQGETGTGKELVARSIHKRSTRHEARIVPVDCGAIPEDLLESEFFGHERGAFTGAHARSLGLLEFTDGGTFFLDEIGELPYRLQAKLLRVLQERSIRRVGGTDEIAVDIRVVAATSRDLESEIKAGRFRDDLYYRINVARIQLPPLRERAEDLPLLIEGFMDRYTQEMGRDGVSLSDEAFEALQSYQWPGNVRQLQNVLRRTLAMARHELLSVQDLPDEIIADLDQRPHGSNGAFFSEREQVLRTFERDFLHRLLKECDGDTALAGQRSGLPRGTLYRLLSRHGLKASQYRE